MAFDFKTPEQLEEFLADKPVRWLRTLAVRSALRVLPVLFAEDSAGEHWMTWLRASFVSWAALIHPTVNLTKSAFPAAIATTYSHSNSVAKSEFGSAYYTAASSIGYAAEAVADNPDSSACLSAIRSSVTSSARISGSFRTFDPAFWRQLNLDLSWLADDETRGDQAALLARLPLWHGHIPKWPMSYWRTFAQNPITATVGYGHWIDWYQALLSGDSLAVDYFGPDLTLRIAQQSEEWWERSAEEVNADIGAWLVEKENSVKVPAPEPGLAGTIDADGRIGFARSGEATADELAGVAGLLQVLTGAAEDLTTLLVGNNSVAIAPSIVPQYLACLRAEALSIDMLYALGVRLGNARAKLQKQIDSKDYPDLTPDVAEALDSVLELHGPVLLSTAEGRRLVDASSDYLRTAADNAALKRAAMNYGQAVANSPDLFNKETRELLPQLNEDVDTGPHPERSTQVAMSASRNLLITVARVALQEVLKEGFLESTQGKALVGVTAFTIQAAWSFLMSYLPVISELAIASGPYLQWIEPLLRKAERRLRK